MLDMKWKTLQRPARQCSSGHLFMRKVEINPLHHGLDAQPEMFDRKSLLLPHDGGKKKIIQSYDEKSGQSFTVMILSCTLTGCHHCHRLVRSGGKPDHILSPFWNKSTHLNPESQFFSFSFDRRLFSDEDRNATFRCHNNQCRIRVVEHRAGVFEPLPPRLKWASQIWHKPPSVFTTAKTRSEVPYYDRPLLFHWRLKCC